MRHQACLMRERRKSAYFRLACSSWIAWAVIFPCVLKCSCRSSKKTLRTSERGLSTLETVWA